jgi:hypothetical protein
MRRSKVGLSTVNNAANRVASNSLTATSIRDKSTGKAPSRAVSAKTVDISNILKDVTCLVEVINSDGTNASASHIDSLRSMGATISDVFGDHLTHYICMNSDTKRARLAPMMGIQVVSPLWIEQCKESQQKVPENDFLIEATAKENVAPSTSSRPLLREPRLGEVASRRDVNSPFFSSSQREFPAEEEPKNKPRAKSTGRNIKVKSSFPQPSPGERSVISSDEDEPYPPKAITNPRKSPTNLKTLPVPSFREYIPPLPPAPSQRRRRSERISDIYDNDEDEMEEAEDTTISDIRPDVPMLILRDESDEHHADEEPAERPKAVKTVQATATSQTSQNPSVKATKKALNGTTSSTSSASMNMRTLDDKLNKLSERPDDDIVIAMTGFDDTDGERSTVSALIAAMIKMFSDKDHHSTTSSSSLSSSAGVSPFPPVVGTAGRFLSNDVDITCQSITVLVASESSHRTQKMLFAVARGLPIVTKDWLFSSLTAGEWVETDAFLHPFAKNATNVSKLFKGESFLVGASADPDPEILAELIRLTGAKLTEDLNAATALLFGNPIDGTAWYASLPPSLASASKAKAMKLANDSKAYTKRVRTLQSQSTLSSSNSYP